MNVNCTLPAALSAHRPTDRPTDQFRTTEPVWPDSGSREEGGYSNNRVCPRRTSKILTDAARRRRKGRGLSALKGCNSFQTFVWSLRAGLSKIKTRSRTMRFALSNQSHTESVSFTFPPVKDRSSIFFSSVVIPIFLSLSFTPLSPRPSP